MRYQLADGNVIIATPEFVAQHYPDAVLLPDPDRAEPEQETAPRHITVGAFFDRFGPLKWAILGDQSPQVQAVIRDASVRTYIDLDNADLPAGLALLVAAGHELDPDAVIDAPVRPEERP